MSGERMNLNEKVTVSVARRREILDLLDLRGSWHTEFWRLKPKSGAFSKFRPDDYHTNLIPTAAKNSLLDTMFNAATQVAANSWFGSLVNNAGWSAFAAGDTMASHAGWTEWTTYSQATRPLWGQGVASAGSITNAAQIVFSITGSGTIKGLMIATNSTKGGTTGVLWSGSPFTSTVDVINGDEIRSTYTLSC